MDVQIPEISMNKVALSHSVSVLARCAGQSTLSPSAMLSKWEDDGVVLGAISSSKKRCGAQIHLPSA